jgi:hypothetical protein
VVGFRENLPNIRQTLLAIKKAEGQRETFLTNPYYLSLWLHLLAISDSSYIPSIDKLHEFELKREMVKGMNKNANDIDEIDPNSLKNTVSVLSVLSFYLLKISLEQETILGVSVNDSELLRLLHEVFSSVNKHNYDSVTRQRLEIYAPAILQNNNSTPLEEDIDFEKLLTAFRMTFFRSSATYAEVEFLVYISSVIEQASKTRLIKFDFDKSQISGFFNQRAGDYLAARYLQVCGLNQFLQGNRINFWLSRSVAIALAISEHPQSVLNYTLPQDSVLETSIVDGLTLIPSGKKSAIDEFVNSLISHFLNEERLFGKEADPCDPLRVLREVRRLCLSGYSPYIILPSNLFKKLLRHRDPGISEAAMITLLTYGSQVGFKRELRKILFNHLIHKAFAFEFIFEGYTKNIWLAIKDAKR